MNVTANECYRAGYAGHYLTDTYGQQRRALNMFSPRYPEDCITDGQCWDEARCRPWPTMDNLIEKGLIERVAWIGPEDGWEYHLTAAGIKLLTDESERP